ncbi:Stp1/IreP family PP2C-type Ser/Thr phosphatase [Candidatus Halobeggiatoa sp. HSG11]|nr:Stp1/IreP family PP2C-type Ser/Thr phosphatase [Candidatus Halobeggiatoa sp. HSG11]
MIYCTDTGRVRKHNEDYIAGDEKLGLAVLADGMGGYQAGEIASEMAVSTIMDYMQAPAKSHVERQTNHRYHSSTVQLEQAVLKANQTIYQAAEKHSEYQGMGTTVVATLFHNNCVSIAHVGDSRLYRIRENRFQQVTKDHSVLQELIDCGFYTSEQARHSPNRNLVTRALGVSEEVNVEIQEQSILAQDVYLLCSDGLNDMLEDNKINEIIQQSNTLEQAAKLLISAANSEGGNDNISLILIKPLDVEIKSRFKWFSRFMNLFLK